MWAKIKTWPIIRILAAVGTAILLVMAAGAVGRTEKRAIKAEDAHQQALATGSQKEIELAEAANNDATEAKDKAKEIAKARLDPMGKSSEDMANVINDWGAERVQ